MNKKIFHIISFVVGITLLIGIGCKSVQPPSYQSNLIVLDSNQHELETTLKMIEPYKTALDSEMNEVLVISAIEFPKEKGKPETLLGNLVADLSIQIIKEKFSQTKIDLCLLNNGGLRTSLPQGEINRGKIFELMPFDNELVIVSMTPEKAKELLQYLYNVGGQPISGAVLDFNFSVDSVFNQLNWEEPVNILTTDYLATGGDKMDFFLTPIQLENTQLKLRDAIIEYCIAENKKGKQLTSQLDGRIRFK